jgi:alpha-L-fucosidase
VETVHKNQPAAFVSGRVGHGLGDYSTLGDMEVPKKNVPGLWESVDVTNDSWGYAWYDHHWKSPQTILINTLATIARGGNYMMNIGPKGDGIVPAEAGLALKTSGAWLKKYPFVYQGKSFPWGHALPWGDAITKGNSIYLLVDQWPSSEKLYLPGLQSTIKAIHLHKGSMKETLSFKKEKNNWMAINVPLRQPEKFISIIELQLANAIKVDETLAIDPEITTSLDAIFAEPSGGVTKNVEAWMEKFGEWKHADRFVNWNTESHATWEVDVFKPGYYNASLQYKGKGRPVWKISIDDAHFIQNEQNASLNYAWYPMGWLHFPKPGHYKLAVSVVQGEVSTLSLSGMQLTPVEF